jgi:hypothetical protein
MIRSLRSPFLVGLAGIAVVAVALGLDGAAQTGSLATISGSWSAEVRAGSVFLQLRTDAPDGGDWNTGRMITIDRFQGLPANAESLRASAVTFALPREAGTLAFDGAFRNGRGGGLFTFAPRAAFAGEMQALGYPGPFALWQQYRFAVLDVGPAYVRALQEEGYRDLPLGEVERGAAHGVTIDYVHGLKARGYRPQTFDDLVRARDHGVTTSYIDGLAQAGFDHLALGDLVRARDHGVTPEFVKELRARGVNTNTLQGFVRLRDHGVNAEYVADMQEIGLKGLSIDEIVRLRDHGVTPGFVRHVRARGYTEDTAEGLIRLKDRGLWR